MFNLANLYNRTGRNAEAEQQFRNVFSTEPDNGEAYYSLGLLLAEENRLDEAAEMLEKAVERIPDRARVQYNYALTLRHLGKNADALDAMIKAHQADKTDPGIVQAIAIFYIQDGQWDRARPYAELLVELVPDAEGPKQMLKQIKAMLSVSESQ